MEPCCLPRKTHASIGWQHHSNVMMKTAIERGCIGYHPAVMGAEANEMQLRAQIGEQESALVTYVANKHSIIQTSEGLHICFADALNYAAGMLAAE